MLRKDYLNGNSLDSIYFGGGTPSVLPAFEIEQLIHIIKRNFICDTDCEITLEANPDDLEYEKISEYREAGINRLSIGIQSFYQEDLVHMNRSHTAAQAIRSIESSLKSGFKNLNIDLIFGGHTTSDDVWKENLKRFSEFNIPHLSCYALTIEPDTAFDRWIKKKRMLPPDPEKFRRQFYMAKEFLENEGYNHYEISNYAKNGQYSIHNRSYWFNEPYLGIGPSAHSYNNKSRQWNVPNILTYIKKLEEGVIPAEMENLTQKDRYNEFIMTRLRTMWGIDSHELRDSYPGFFPYFEEKIKSYTECGYVYLSGKTYYLSRNGLIFADLISAELFCD